MARPFRLSAPEPAETELHQQVADALTVLVMPPAEWTTFPAGHVELSPAAAAKLARLGLQRSWPDIIVLHGIAYGIELKRRGAALSRARMVRTRRGRLRHVEGQRDVFPRLERAGMRIAVCSTVAEVLAALRGWNVPLRRTSGLVP